MTRLYPCWYSWVYQPASRIEFCATYKTLPPLRSCYDGHSLRASAFWPCFHLLRYMLAALLSSAHHRPIRAWYIVIFPHSEPEWSTRTPSQLDYQVSAWATSGTSRTRSRCLGVCCSLDRHRRQIVSEIWLKQLCSVSWRSRYSRAKLSKTAMSSDKEALLSLYSHLGLQLHRWQRVVQIRSPCCGWTWLVAD